LRFVLVLFMVQHARGGTDSVIDNHYICFQGIFIMEELMHYMAISAMH